MRKRLTVLAVTAFLVCLGSSLEARADAEPSARLPSSVPLATIVAIRGNIVTIADARGNRKTLEVVSAKGLAVGAKIDWCEEDCRLLRTGDTSVQVKRKL